MQTLGMRAHSFLAPVGQHQLALSGADIEDWQWGPIGLKAEAELGAGQVATVGAGQGQHKQGPPFCLLLLLAARKAAALSDCDFHDQHHAHLNAVQCCHADVPS